MEITHEEVRHIAELAKLELTDEEVTLYAGQLSECFQYFQRLQTLDTTHIQPTDSVLPLQNVMRTDTPAEPLPLEDVVANAADAQDYQFRVNAVLGEE